MSIPVLISNFPPFVSPPTIIKIAQSYDKNVTNYTITPDGIIVYFSDIYKANGMINNITRFRQHIQDYYLTAKLLI